ncbi:GM10918 [Drosophila sechellia]|uniref:GM10918 n=1 Tax=Drosophila sechellia TaxID=7238 RepID=B4I4L7_DROSE|nr:GM10918 [Drosophila sechellia]
MPPPPPSKLPLQLNRTALTLYVRHNTLEQVAKKYGKVVPVLPGDQQNLIAYGVELKSQPGIVLQVDLALPFLRYLYS